MAATRDFVRDSGMDDVSLAEFEIGAVIGQGGMATVHRATFKPTGEEVALKLMLANVADDPTFIERFRREVKAMMGLRHENICRVIAAGEGDGRLFMAMEIIDGGSVRELKQRLGGKFPVLLAAEIVRQLLHALGEAHRHGVIHRDLKPANLMLTRTGILKLVDFGIAKKTTDNTLTATGMLVGTPAYMSPEQVRGDGIDGRSDLFASGLILHDLLCGRSPFYADNPGTSLVKVLQEEVPGMFDVLFGVDPQLEAFHGTLTQREPEKRYADADDALRALEPWLLSSLERYPDLVADCLRNPAGMKKQLNREQGEQELERARALVRKHGPIPAAALALENVTHIDPSSTVAKEELAAISEPLGFHTDLRSDARIAETEAALKTQRDHPGLLKRLADLHRAAGNLRESARALKRYLRLKDDVAALQQLVVLLWGPGSDPSLVTGTLQRLRTQDIMAGVKTGGMPAIRPDSEVNARKRAAAGLTDLSDEKRAAIAAAARNSTQTGLGRAMGTSTASDDARVIRELSSDAGFFSTIREQVGGYFWLGVAGVVVLTIILVGAKLSSGLVKEAQTDMRKHVEGSEINEEANTFNWQRTKLNEAKIALEKGSFVSCSIAATQALEGEKTAKLVLDAKWLMAQCSLLARDYSSARNALEDFKDNANINDRRYETGKAQLRAIERGEKPGGVRTW